MQGRYIKFSAAKLTRVRFCGLFEANVIFEDLHLGGTQNKLKRDAKRIPFRMITLTAAAAAPAHPLKSLKGQNATNKTNGADQKIICDQ